MDPSWSQVSAARTFYAAAAQLEQPAVAGRDCTLSWTLLSTPYGARCLLLASPLHCKHKSDPSGLSTPPSCIGFIFSHSSLAHSGSAKREPAGSPWHALRTSSPLWLPWLAHSYRQHQRGDHSNARNVTQRASAGECYEFVSSQNSYQPWSYHWGFTVYNESFPVSSSSAQSDSSIHDCCYDLEVALFH